MIIAFTLTPEELAAFRFQLGLPDDGKEPADVEALAIEAHVRARWVAAVSRAAQVDQELALIETIRTKTGQVSVAVRKEIAAFIDTKLAVPAVPAPPPLPDESSDPSTALDS